MERITRQGSARYNLAVFDDTAVRFLTANRDVDDGSLNFISMANLYIDYGNMIMI